MKINIKGAIVEAPETKFESMRAEFEMISETYDKLCEMYGKPRIFMELSCRYHDIAQQIAEALGRIEEI